MNRIYIACLASYNQGILHGDWITVSSNVEEVKESINEILKASPVPCAEEWAIHDSECFEFNVREYHSLGALCEYVHAIELGYSGVLVAGIMDNFSYTPMQAVEYLEDNYIGEYTSIEEWAEQSLDGSINLPKELENYFDYSSYARDCELNGYIFTIREGINCIHVIYNS